MTRKKNVPQNDANEQHRPMESSAPEPAPNPFDPDALRLDQEFEANLGVKKLLTTVPCRKPNRQEWVRVRPGEEWRLLTAVLEDKVTGETYLVERSLWADLAGEVSPVCLFLAVNRQNDVFLWPVKMPGPDGRSNSWNDSSLKAAHEAETTWVRVVANRTAGYYDVFQAAGELSDPKWPEQAFDGILKLSFQDRFIRDRDHPVLRALRGEL